MKNNKKNAVQIILKGILFLAGAAGFIVLVVFLFAITESTAMTFGILLIITGIFYSIVIKLQNKVIPAAVIINLTLIVIGIVLVFIGLPAARFTTIKHITLLPNEQQKYVVNFRVPDHFPTDDRLHQLAIRLEGEADFSCRAPMLILTTPEYVYEEELSFGVLELDGCNRSEYDDYQSTTFKSKKFFSLIPGMYQIEVIPQAIPSQNEPHLTAVVEIKRFRWPAKTEGDKYVQTQLQQIVNQGIQQSENLIIGEWFPLDVSKGGLGEGITFFADGKFTSTVGIFVHFKYKLEGDLLTTMDPNGSDAVQKVEITEKKIIFSGNILSGGNNEKYELTRIGGNANDGIIGKWTGDHYTGGKYIEYFTSSQRYLSVPAKSYDGTYKIKGDILEIEFPGLFKEKTMWRWSVNGDNLTVTTVDEKQTFKYMKIK